MVAVYDPVCCKAVAAMIWLQVAVATAVGFACGFWLALEVGRIIYNRKMDEIKAEVEAMRTALRR